MIVKPTTRFKKDYKRYKHDVEKDKTVGIHCKDA